MYNIYIYTHTHKYILEHFTSFPSAYEWKNPGAGYFFGAKIGEDDNFECGYF